MHFTTMLTEEERCYQHPPQRQGDHSPRGNPCRCWRHQHALRWKTKNSTQDTLFHNTALPLPAEGTFLVVIWDSFQGADRCLRSSSKRAVPKPNGSSKKKAGPHDIHWEQIVPKPNKPKLPQPCLHAHVSHQCRQEVHIGTGQGVVASITALSHVGVLLPCSKTESFDVDYEHGSLWCLPL